jgi:hypothetical protein
MAPTTPWRSNVVTHLASGVAPTDAHPDGHQEERERIEALESGKVTLPAGLPSGLSVLTLDSSGAPGTALLQSVVPGLPLFYDSTTGAIFTDPAYSPNQPLPPTPPPPPGPPATVQYPAQVLDLRPWKETTPTNTNRTGAPDEWYWQTTGADLGTFVDPINFYPATAADDGANIVVFHAATDGFTTSSSSYPRSELREMVINPDGTPAFASGRAVEASWGCNDGKTHSFEYVGAWLHLPELKPQVVMGQIHNANDDVIEILGDGLAVSGKVTITYRFRGATSSTHILDNYTIGTYLHFKVTASGGTIRIYCVDMTTPKATITGVSDTGCYFKVGCYTQESVGKQGSAAAGQYGQTALKSVTPPTHV